MKKFAALLIALALPGSSWAQVILPESGRLAGPLNYQASEFGDEFLAFPDFMAPVLGSERIGLTGWVEIEFGEPVANVVDFSLSYGAVGSSSLVEWTGGQQYPFAGNRVVRLDDVNSGRLNLETGEVTNMTVRMAFLNGTTNALLSKINRIAPGFAQFYPAPNFPVSLPDEPGFEFSEGFFSFDSEGRITGFEFLGQTALPLGFVAVSNPVLRLLPLQAFGPRGELYFPNPASCQPGTAPADCPTNETHPNGILLPQDVLFHPRFFLRSDELREVPATRVTPPCAPDAGAGNGTLAAVSGKIYRVAGVAGEVSGRVDVYDPEDGSWQAGPALPQPVTDAQIAVLGSNIYVIGGRLPGEPATARLQVFDTSSEIWSELSAAPNPVARGAATVFGDSIYVFGGRTNRPNGSPRGNLRLSDVVQIYNPAADAWTVIPAVINGLKIFRDAPAVAGVGAEIYVIGGMDRQGEVTNQVLVLDTLTNRFRVGPPALWGAYEASAGLIGDRLFVVGGRRISEGTSVADAQFLEISGGEWLDAEPQPLATAASGAAVANGQLFVVGGVTRADGEFSPGQATAAVQAFDPARGWSVCASRPLFTAAQVVSSASLTVGPRPLSPGSQASLTGFNLAAETLTAPDEPIVATELGGVSLTIDGLAAPILAVSPGRIDFQVPYGARSQGAAELVVTNAVLPSQAAAVAVPMAETSPGIFVQSCGSVDEGRFLDEASAIACHGDGSLNYAANAIRPGDEVIVQMTGLGGIITPLANGERAPEGGVAAVSLPRLTVRGSQGEALPATVLSATLAPGEVGIFDVRVEVPAGSLESNRTVIEATAGGVVSNRAVLAVGEPVAGSPLPCQRDTDPAFRACVP